MQSCAGCGRPHRPGVHYCTQCGRPTTASQAGLRGPTGVAAVVVLSIGLLAFLTIRPIVPRSTTSAIAVVAPVLQAHEPPTPERGALASGSVVDIVDSDVGANASVRETATSDVAQAVSATEVLPVPATVDAALQAAQALLGDPAPALDDPASALDDPASAHKAAPARPSRPALPSSSSPARHAALDATPARRVAKLPATAGRSWLGTLRAELEACDGGFIARTICRERAKFRHCGSADAWGEVPECPAARVPEY